MTPYIFIHIFFKLKEKYLRSPPTPRLCVQEIFVIMCNLKAQFSHKSSLLVITRVEVP